MTLPIIDDSPCSACHGGCCRSFVVPLTGRDIRRIGNATGRKLWDYACRWEDDGASIPPELAPRLTFPDAPDRSFVIGIRHVASRQYAGTNCCEFLTEPPGPSAPDAAAQTPPQPARCAIHPARPGVCRLFPLKWDSPTEHVQRALPKFGKPTEHEAYRLCPRDWTIDEMRAAHPLTLHEELRAELLVWHEVVSLWNESKLPVESLPEFIEAVYTGLERSQPKGLA